MRIRRSKAVALAAIALLAASQWQVGRAQESKPPGLVFQALLNEGNGNEITVTSGKTEKKVTASGNVEWIADGKLGKAPLITGAVAFELGDVLDLDKDKGFSYGAWVKPSGIANGAIFGRMDQDAEYRGWDLWVQDRNFGIHLINKWPENALKVVTTDAPMKPAEWQHVFITYDGSAKFDGVKIYVNGLPVNVAAEADALTDTIHTTTPFCLGRRSKPEQLFNGGQMQDVRVYSRKLEAAEVKMVAEVKAK